jgi:hypothetical protein
LAGYPGLFTAGGLKEKVVEMSNPCDRCLINLRKTHRVLFKACNGQVEILEVLVKMPIELGPGCRGYGLKKKGKKK